MQMPSPNSIPYHIQNQEPNNYKAEFASNILIYIRAFIPFSFSELQKIQSNPDLSL